MKKFGFGLMRLPLLDADDTRSVDIETVKKMADQFLAARFTYFDTAKRDRFSRSGGQALSA